MTALAQTNSPLAPRWQLRALQAVWLIAAAVAVMFLFLAMPDYPALFREIFVERDVALESVGLPATLRASYYPILDTVWLISFLSTALIIFARRRNDPVAIHISMILLIFPFASLPIWRALNIHHAEWSSLMDTFRQIGIFLSYTFGFVFPDGRFVPRWTRWVVLGIALWMLSWPVTPILAPYSYPPGINLILDILPFMGAIAAQIYRYRRISSPVQRQQTKWVILAFTLAVIGYICFQIPEMLFNTERASLIEIFLHLVATNFYRGAEMFVPIAIAFAMLRYRLWDVDFYINRTLIYGALTIVLAAVFLAMIFVLQPILLTLTGGGQPTIAAIGATLAAAGAFTPARKGLRRLVDRELYGIKVDYSKPAPQPQPASSDGDTTSVGPYGGLRLIGRGGMGEVYRGEHPTNGKSIAVKLLPAALASETDFRTRFEREARTLSALDHPNIVRVYEHGEAAGIPYLVMEYIAGRDLSEHLRKTGPMPVAEASAILTEVAAALDYAHSKGLVHRDIKSSNVMLEDGAPSQRAVLMDFGIAKMSEGTALTNTGVLGTFEYMSPEQIQAASDVDRRADVYSLGVVAYQMLTGQLPFTATSPAAILIAHLQTPPRDPSSLRPDLPEETADALLKALEKDPSHRFASAGAFAAALC